VWIAPIDFRLHEALEVRPMGSPQRFLTLGEWPTRTQRKAIGCG
jgi:hypothetical protein